MYPVIKITHSPIWLNLWHFSSFLFLTPTTKSSFTLQLMKYVRNNLSHLVLSWWSKETAMVINFVLDFSSQTFLALELIDLHTSSHFELRFRFFVLSLAVYHFLEMEICHIFSAHIITSLLKWVVSWNLCDEQLWISMQSETEGSSYNSMVNLIRKWRFLYGMKRTKQEIEIM